MKYVSTVSSGTTGAYEPYGFGNPSYDTDSGVIESFGLSTVKSAKPYEGTGVWPKKRPRDAGAYVCAKMGAARAAARIMRPFGRPQASGVAE